MKQKTKKKFSPIVFVIGCILLGIFLFKSMSRPLVCIDAGHGGKDVGSISTNGKRYEKDDNLKIALKVKEKLKSDGIRVVMTRKNDSYVSLEKRCQIANFWKSDVFVSIHRNSAKSGEGIEIWIQNDASESEKKLAENILENLSQEKVQNNRGVKNGTNKKNGTDYFVNKGTNMPSCIVELGFISNQKDNELLDKNLDAYAQAIAEGIEESLEKK